MEVWKYIGENENIIFWLVIGLIWLVVGVVFMMVINWLSGRN